MINKANLFTLNDLISVKINAPISYFPGEIAVVCGMEQVNSDELSDLFKSQYGEWIYTIEFGDGSSIEVPEIYLEDYLGK